MLYKQLEELEDLEHRIKVLKQNFDKEFKKQIPRANS